MKKNKIKEKREEEEGGRINTVLCTQEHDFLIESRAVLLFYFASQSWRGQCSCTSRAATKKKLLGTKRI